MPRTTRTVCSCTGCTAHPASCPTITNGGRCDSCTAAAEQARGTAHARGYTPQHRARFREGVLARHPYCTVRGPNCTLVSTVADHWPIDRRQLAASGLDPDDPQHGRGTCHNCHSQETAKHQPGGWNR